MNDSSIFTLERGNAPLLISIPHRGTQIPCALADEMTPVAKRTEDCDWHLERLYAFARELGASILTPQYARYVIDLNRPPDDENLYPGRDTTGLCPVDTFDKAPLYKPGHAPSREQIEARRVMYWQPYHDALVGELDALRRAHDRVLLWEAHSIRSVVPRFFDGRLPDFNFGTADDASATPGLAEHLARIVEDDGRYSTVANGRFKGGYITRHYGRPSDGIHAIQLELTQGTYMNESAPFNYEETLADRVQPLLRNLVTAALAYVTGS
ncbi:N-formylglutamate amidohydrolase [Caballeronia hypogeia]|uniref:N-formylglutamate amidohydrolase n=1 Tax=Caballeronia hypogeia TaxID=1777140 RepID=A0A158AL33_9BURK|nr:N-formylglutamate deformylase [Caballeronia hypogeia]SAK58522.1 N-formylglutamate amidohydrolase [Caballeronia hypogeia]